MARAPKHRFAGPANSGCSRLLHSGERLTLIGNICANNTAAEDKCEVKSVRAKGAVAVATAALADLAHLARLDLELNYRLS